MNDTTILLKAYYESLYDKLFPVKEHILERMNVLLTSETGQRYAGMLNKEKYKAYFDTCAAFWDERMEFYNPIGIQFLFENVSAKKVYELELQLSWYDSRKELQELLELVRQKTEPDMTDERIRISAEQIIQQAGAFPDKSIISTYLEKPSLEKVPDYILALAIEEILSEKI